jgi:L-ascorbate metabolism protein UlaG (beta-lactamase superfamily)
MMRRHRRRQRGFSPYVAGMTRNRYYQGPPSDHFDGVRFFNPSQGPTDKGLRDMLRWKMAGGTSAWPASVPVLPVKPEARVDGVRVTMVGHVTMLIQAAGLNILTDPVWSDRASPLSFIGPKRVTEPGIAFEDLPPIDAVLISHCHYDHMDMATLRRLAAAHDPLFAMPLGNDTILRASVPEARCVVGDWWQSLPIAPGFETVLTPAYHWANRWPTDVRMALWSGHRLSTPAGTIWFAGDTGYGDGEFFAQIRALGPPDLALIPIGAYEPRWFMAAQHVNPEEAVRIFQDVGAVQALGIHWGTFQLTDESRDAPVVALEAARAKAGIPARLFAAAEPAGVYDFEPGRTPDRS